MDSNQEEKGIFVGEGVIKVDPEYMTRKVDEELEKIINEKMRPFLLSYENIKWQIMFLTGLGVFFLLTFLILFSSQILSSVTAAKLLPLLIFSSGILLVSSIVLSSCTLFPEENKVRQVEKTFRKIAGQLRLSAIEGKTDISKLKLKFDLTLFNLEKIK